MRLLAIEVLALALLTQYWHSSPQMVIWLAVCFFLVNAKELRQLACAPLVHAKK